MSPRSEQQFLALREKSRERILEAATELFARQGYHGTSIKAIAHAAGVSKGLMYNYFDSKEDLLDDILKKGFEDISAPMEQLIHLNDPFERLEAIIEGAFAMVRHKQDRIHWQFLVSIMTQHDVMKRMHAMFSKYMKAYLSTFESIFEAMQVKNPRVESYRLAAIIDGVMLHYLSLFGKSYPLDEIKKDILDDYEKYRVA